MPSSVKFKPENDIPDLSGKVILVTGGNIGLGRETIYQIVKHQPGHIYLAARNEAKAQQTIAALKKAVPNAPITFLELDLTSFASIKKAAATFKAASPRLDILINNAGIMACPAGVTKEGYEIQFGTNHVGHALLTKLLLPTLESSSSPSASNPKPDVRIITVSSGAHNWAPKGPNPYPFTELKTPTASLPSTFARYGISKLANIHYSHHLARAHPAIKCIAVHPGFVDTNLTSGPAASYPYAAWVIRAIAKMTALSVQQGAENQLWAATRPEPKTGVFYFPVGLEGKDSKQARDQDGLGKQLWDWTERELEGHS